VSLRQVALSNVQIGPADPATTHAQPHLTWTWHGIVALPLAERPTLDRPGSADPPRAHTPTQPDNFGFRQGCAASPAYGGWPARIGLISGVGSPPETGQRTRITDVGAIEPVVLALALPLALEQGRCADADAPRRSR
jgi:hypothetical protein